MPLQFRADTGGILMLESGSLANACCCDLVPDLTPIMRSLSEALHYIADENSLNQEFGGAQGDAWPTQRTAPFLPPPPDGEDIPPDYYEEDYLADIQNAYDDLQTIINNYNYVKNFFLKTDPFEGATSLANFTGADDYAPGTIDASNFEAIRDQIVDLVNAILNAMVQGSQTFECCKTIISQIQMAGGVGDWQNRQDCAIDMIDNVLECGDNKFAVALAVGPGCGDIFDAGACAPGFIENVETTDFDLDVCLQSDATLHFVSGIIEADLTNFPLADQSGVYLKTGAVSVLDYSAFGPVPLPDVYQKWITPTLGAPYTSPTVTGSDDRLQFTFTGPTPACTGGNPVFGSSFRILDQVVILTRTQNHVAS